MAPPMTRGPLPARVYWVRRLMVLGTALLLVFAIGRLLGGGSDGSDGDAAHLTADNAATTPSVTDAGTPSRTAQKPGKKKTDSPDPTPTLAAPTGECDGTDIAVTPLVKDRAAGRDVRIVLQLRTLETPACTWAVGPGTMTVDITSGKDDIWSSRECPGAIPKESVVVRQAVTSKVEVVWPETRRSDEGCTKWAGWALPGWYHVTAAALGGEPSDLQFQLVKPTPATVTKTVRPSPSATATGRPNAHPSGSPSGSVHPD